MSVPQSPSDFLLVMSEVESVLKNSLLHHSVTFYTRSFPINVHGQRLWGDEAVAIRQQRGHRSNSRDDLSTTVAFGKPF
jgi:hypothetical protein